MMNNFGYARPSFNSLVEDTLLNRYNCGDIVKIKGICIKELYYDGIKEFGIYRVENTDGEKFKVKGGFSNPLVEGQTYSFSGIVAEYKMEKQLAVKEYYPCKPLNKKGIIAYLQTLYGLKSKAEQIYDVFGDDSIKVLMEDPMKVASSIKGIGKKSVVKWQVQLKELEEDQYLYIKLLGYGVSEKNATTLLKKYGARIVELIEKNPYMLMKEIRGYGFLKCDKLALENGLSPNSDVRIQAGIIHTLKEFSNEGNCYCPYNELVEKVCDKISISLSYREMISLLNKSKHNSTTKFKYCNAEYDIDIATLSDTIEAYSKATLKEKSKHRYKLFELDKIQIDTCIKTLLIDREIYLDKGRVYLKNLYEAEVSFAKKIRELTVYKEFYKRNVVEQILNEICKEKGYELEEKQREACIEFNLYKTGIFILNGSAGTGKTFTLNLILEVSKRLRNKDNNILLVAPTGKASKVAQKSTGRECSTIHRALGYCEGGFAKCEDEPFDEEIIVCDESGMINIELGNSFAKAIQNNSKLILMGDIQQLPSVGAGNVLKDLLECGAVKVITLNVPKRQDVLSGININANRIISGNMIRSELKTKDFYVLQKNEIETVKDCVIKSIQRLLTYPGYTLEDIQVLLPQRAGSLGVNMFNYLLQKQFNYNGTTGNKVSKFKFEARERENSPIKEYELFICEGDKVIHTQNNYNMIVYKKTKYGLIEHGVGITNGECGVVETITKDKKGYTIIVRYEDFYVKYDSVDEIELCYATTIHKSQGSAWKAIILPVVMQHFQMLSSNILYTGITRAREFCAVIGSSKAINTAINTRTAMDRYTGLAERICA